MKRTVAAALLLAACASTPPPPPQPPPTALPPAVIESFCGLLHSEGMTAEVRAINTTQPIITSESLQALAERALTKPRGPLPASIMASGSIPVLIPSPSCIARGIDAYDATRDADVMVLQLSVPFPNPFAGGQPGVMARLSLANETATWYWIPLAPVNGRWLAGAPMELGLR